MFRISDLYLLAGIGHSHPIKRLPEEDRDTEPSFQNIPANLPCFPGYQSTVRCLFTGYVKTSAAPCPKCGMNMIATSEQSNSRQDFQCLRCGHQETRRLNGPNRPMLAVA